MTGRKSNLGDVINVDTRLKDLRRITTIINTIINTIIIINNIHNTSQMSKFLILTQEQEKPSNSIEYVLNISFMRFIFLPTVIPFDIADC